MTDRPTSKRNRVTIDMIRAGAAAYRSFDDKAEEPEALVFEIISLAFEIEERNGRSDAERGVFRQPLDKRRALTP